MQRRRKERNAGEKDSAEQIKQIKTIVAEGKALLERGGNEDLQAAVAVLGKGLNRCGPNGHPTLANQLHHLRGLAQLKLRHFTEAEKDLQEAILTADDKSKIGFYSSLGKCRMEMAAQGQPSMNEEAMKCFEKVIELSGGTDGDAHLKLGLLYRRTGTYPAIRAIRHFTDALKLLKPVDQFEALMERGVCYREVQEMHSSTEDFGKACELRKDDPHPHFQLGLNYLLGQSWEQALQQLSAAIQIDKSQPQFFNYKAVALAMSNQHEHSLTIFSEALQLYQASGERSEQVGECWFNRGDVLLSLGRYKEALHHFQRATEHPFDSSIKIKLLYSEGRALEPTDPQAAINKFQECQQQIGENFNHSLYLSCLYHLALNQNRTLQYSQSVTSLSSILAAGCTDRCVFLERGKALLSNQEYEAALEDFEKAWTLDQEEGEVYFYKGKAKTQLGQMDSAIKDFFRSVELGAGQQKVFNGISEAYLRGGRLEKALIYSNLCLEREPLNEQFLIQRSRIEVELKHFQRAIQDLTAALKLNNRNPLVYYRRGLAHYHSQNYSDAISDLETALQNHPRVSQQADIYYHIAIAHAHLEQYAEALVPLTSAIEIDPKSKYYHERAKCHLLLENHSSALKDLHRVIQRQPANAFAHFRRAFAHKALKRYTEAAQDFMRARQLAPQDPRLIINKKQIYQTKYRKLCPPGFEQ